MLAVIGLAAWWQTRRDPVPIVSAASQAVVSEARERSVRTPAFRCEGKTRCAQMTSCEEATFYMRNCPGVGVDGDNDGVPCESHLCEHR
jgi:hypothetical protein